MFKTILIKSAERVFYGFGFGIGMGIAFKMVPIERNNKKTQIIDGYLFFSGILKEVKKIF